MVAETWVSTDQIAEHLGGKRDSIYPRIVLDGCGGSKVSEVDDWVRAAAPMKKQRGDVQTPSRKA